MIKSRGYRNNNPLNIRRTDTDWFGLREVQTDRDFFQFEDMYLGYRAAIRILHTYQRKYSLFSLRDIISRWAPPFENDTEEYIRIVSNRAKVRPDAYVDLGSKDLVSRIVEAMSYVENGTAGDMLEIAKGFDAAAES